jgi:hypothetical protein
VLLWAEARKFEFVLESSNPSASARAPRSSTGYARAKLKKDLQVTVLLVPSAYSTEYFRMYQSILETVSILLLLRGSDVITPVGEQTELLYPFSNVRQKMIFLSGFTEMLAADIGRILLLGCYCILYLEIVLCNTLLLEPSHSQDSTRIQLRCLAWLARE